MLPIPLKKITAESGLENSKKTCCCLNSGISTKSFWTLIVALITKTESFK